MKSVNLAKQGQRPALYVQFDKKKIINANYTVGFLSGQLKCQFITEAELNDRAQQREQL